MARYDILTGLNPRRRVRYSDIVRAEAPEAKRRYFADQSFRLSQDALEQDRAQAEAAFDFQRQEAERNAALQREQLEQAEQQAMFSNTISSLGLAKAAYPYAKKGVSAVSNLISPSETPAAAADVAPAYQSSGVGEAVAPDIALAEGASPYAAYGYAEPAIQYGTSPALEALFAESATAPTAAAAGEGALNAYGAGEAAIGGLGAGETVGSSAAGEAGAAAGGGLSWWGGPVIAGVTIGQMAAARNAKPVEGVQPGHFFSQNESGNYRPWFSEPDKNLVSQMYGGGPTVGARFDARLQQGDWQGAGKALPGFAHGYAIPGLDAAENIIGGYAERQGAGNLAKVSKALADPVGSISSSLAEADDIGDVAATILTGGVSDGSHLCTMIKQEVGLTRKEMLMMRLFKNWVEAHHREDHDKYIKLFGKIASKIRSSANGAQEIFMDLKKAVVDSVITLMDKDDIEGAYLTYKGKCLELYQEYGE